jgi:hypothetical protein
MCAKDSLSCAFKSVGQKPVYKVALRARSPVACNAKEPLSSRTGSHTIALNFIPDFSTMKKNVRQSIWPIGVMEHITKILDL